MPAGAAGYGSTEFEVRYTLGGLVTHPRDISRFRDDRDRMEERHENCTPDELVRAAGAKKH